MKLDEFKKQVRLINDNLYVEVPDGNPVKVYTVDFRKLVGTISNLNMNSMTTYNVGFDGLNTETKSKLQKLMYKFSRTPIDERKPEKKFYVKVPKEWDKYSYFFKYQGIGFIDNKYIEDAHFTMQEIKDYKLESFERVEVKD